MSFERRIPMPLRYGLNPNQAWSELRAPTPNPLHVINGNPSYINVLDALRGWQLAREMRKVLGAPAAASFKHVNPAGAAIGSEKISDDYRKAHFLPDWEWTPLAIAYVRARQGDRIASYGDFAALSDSVDLQTARILKSVASDGVIAAAYDPGTIEILKSKKSGGYIILRIDSEYVPAGQDWRDEFGFCLGQDRDLTPISASWKSTAPIPSSSSLPTTTLCLAQIVAKYTQSNAVVIAHRDQAIGVGSGQQSRIAATRIACEKAEQWMLYEHPRVLSLEFHHSLTRIEKMNLVDIYLRGQASTKYENELLRGAVSATPPPITQEERRPWFERYAPLCLASDGSIPFRDNVDRAHQCAVTHIVQPGGSRRDDQVSQAAKEHAIIMLHTGRRSFLH
jgi:phosphoribosylaminoimidazolecarboxamide formyltransferase / IMP cyclohydrolase